jgi:SAM-dependent methyltransferase
MAHASVDSPSPWVARWAGLVERGPVLDVASGSGRHARVFIQKNLSVIAVDREAQTIPGARFVQADLEDGSPWPFAGERFGAIVVTNYLHRPLLPILAESLAEGGVLIYETFMLGNERFGRPSNPNFLLRPGELLEAFGALTLVAFEQGMTRKQGRTEQAVVQRICVIRAEANSVRIPA